MDVKVSVIIPVYNVEKYIGRCVHSLFSQTLNEMEFIFVDDCTPDNSIEIIKSILKEYPNRKHQVKFVTHNVNKGLAKSRQDGLEQAVGKYIIHCDSDDWLECNMYEALCDKAVETHADIVICNYFEESDAGAVVMSQHLFEDKDDLFAAILEGKLHAAVWNKLVKREFLFSCPYKIPTEIFMWEDMAVMVPLLMATNRIVKLDKPLYHYAIKREGSITALYDAGKTASMLKCVDYIEQYMKDAGIYKDFTGKLYSLRLRASAGLISQTECWSPNLWREKNNDASIKDIFNSNMWWSHQIYAVLAKLRLDVVIKTILKFRAIFPK